MVASLALPLRALTQEYLRAYPDEAAAALEAQPIAEVADLLEQELASRAATILERLSPRVGAGVLEVFANVAFQTVVPAMDPAVAASLLARFDEAARDHRLSLLDARHAQELRELMTYERDRAGALMDPRVTAFLSRTTVAQALERLREAKEYGDVFVIDSGGRLLGRVALGELAIASPSQNLDEIMRRPAVVPAVATRQEVIEVLAETKLPSLPVVDVEGRLLGVIRHRALVAAAEQEASADIQTMVGVSKEERALSPVPFAVRQRLPWLEVNLATAFLAAAVVGIFEETIARVTALAVLMPIAAGQSGNTGAQALAVTLRGIALREVRLSHWAALAWKELRLGLVNGLAVGVTTSAGVYLWSRSIGLALVIGIAMLVSMVIAGLAGTSVPLVLKAFGQDPAHSSSIVLTTITDVAGFLSFLGLATLLAGLL